MLCDLATIMRVLKSSKMVLVRRSAMTKGGVVPVDLLKDFSHVQTTLGFRIGVKSLDGHLISCVVQQVKSIHKMHCPFEEIVRSHDNTRLTKKFR